MRKRMKNKRRHQFLYKPIIPHENDVLLGRGGNNSRYIGNEQLRELARQECERYRRSSKKEKSLISMELVITIRAMNPPGRFLKRNDITMEWEEVGNCIARLKTSQVLRDVVAAHKKCGASAILNNTRTGSSTKRASIDNSCSTSSTQIDVVTNDDTVEEKDEKENEPEHNPSMMKDERLVPSATITFCNESEIDSIDSRDAACIFDKRCEGEATAADCEEEEEEACRLWSTLSIATLSVGTPINDDRIESDEHDNHEAVSRVVDPLLETPRKVTSTLQQDLSVPNVICITPENSSKRSYCCSSGFELDSTPREHEDKEGIETIMLPLLDNSAQPHIEVRPYPYRQPSHHAQSRPFRPSYQEYSVRQCHSRTTAWEHGSKVTAEKYVKITAEKNVPTYYPYHAKSSFQPPSPTKSAAIRRDSTRCPKYPCPYGDCQSCCQYQDPRSLSQGELPTSASSIQQHSPSYYLDRQTFHYKISYPGNTANTTKPQEYYSNHRVGFQYQAFRSRGSASTSYHSPYPTRYGAL